jgi:hypothetical protein
MTGKTLGLPCVGLLTGALTAYGYQQWTPRVAAVGPKLQRECVSVVDTVLAPEPERTVDNGRLRHELSKLGIAAPEYPQSPTLPDSRTSDWFKKWQEKDAKYAARVKTYTEEWERLRERPAYNRAGRRPMRGSATKPSRDVSLSARGGRVWLFDEGGSSAGGVRIVQESRRDSPAPYPRDSEETTGSRPWTRRSVA